jgi:selenocysteine lyase/cysteine desulfurase
MREARQATLDFLDADASDYDVIFAANASCAIRILAESFPFSSRSRLVLTTDNHNSVNGLRKPAAQRGAKVNYVPLRQDMISAEPDGMLEPTRCDSLFAFPAQSNFSGVQHPLEWVQLAQAAGYKVLLDAAAYLPTHRLSLREHPADFIALSYYKLFGYPTGIGALIARHDALQLLQRSYFAGGTMEYVSVRNAIERAKPGGEAYEDGTPNFLAMTAVCDGLQWLCALGTQRIAEHSNFLAKRFVQGLAAMGTRAVIYGPQDFTTRRGSTIAFNLRADTSVLPFEEIEAAGRQRGIALRGGCFCNPGASEIAFEMPNETALACMLEPNFSIKKLRARLQGVPVGALRASFGPANTAADVDALLDFIATI